MAAENMATQKQVVGLAPLHPAQSVLAPVAASNCPIAVPRPGEQVQVQGEGQRRVASEQMA